MQWTIEEAPDRLIVIVDGEFVLSTALKMVDEVERVGRARGYDRILIDCRTAAGLIAEDDKFLTGTRIAQRFGSARVAVVFSPGPRITGFAGNVAARRGGSLLVTDDINEALRYLAGEDS